MSKKILAPCLLYFGIVIVTIWIIGFGAFCLYALSFRFQQAEKTDAIVVLTGGGERVQTALNLLKEQYADHLLISGVNRSVQLSDLTANLNPELAGHVTLGYRAQNTRGNAKETAGFIREHRVHTLLLVTSFYHMPRSVFEILKESPDVQIIPLPVFPKSFYDSVDWIRTRYAWLLLVEYHKFIATRAQYLIERILYD